MSLVFDWMRENLPPPQFDFYIEASQFLSNNLDYERHLDELETEILNNNEDIIACLGPRILTRIFHNHLYQLLLDHGFLMDIKMVPHISNRVMFDCLQSLYLAKYFTDKFEIDSIIVGLEEEDSVLVYSSLVTFLTNTKQNEVLEFITDVNESLLYSLTSLSHDEVISDNEITYKYIRAASELVGTTIIGRDVLIACTLQPNQYTIMDLYNLYKDRFEKVSLIQLPLELTALVAASSEPDITNGSDIDKLVYNIVSSPNHAESVLMKIRGYCLRINGV